MENNYLSHHGIKGQQWGIRRYQNSDGSLTSEGRARYGVNDVRSRIRVIRSDTNNRIRLERAQNKERIRYEKAKKKMDAKFQRDINAEKDRENRKAIKIEKKQIAQFKRKHPLKYAAMKKYLTKDGTLNDAGRIRFFGNGEKKTINKMSTKELRDAKYRLDAEENYKYVANKVKNGKASNKFLRSIFNAGATFATIYGGRKIINKLTKGELYKENSDTIKAAIAAMSGVLLTSLGINGVKTGNPFNDRDFNKKDKNKNDKNDKNKGGDKNNDDYDDYVDNPGTGYRYYNYSDGTFRAVPLDQINNGRRRS